MYIPRYASEPEFHRIPPSFSFHSVLLSLHPSEGVKQFAEIFGTRTPFKLLHPEIPANCFSPCVSINKYLPGFILPPSRDVHGVWCFLSLSGRNLEVLYLCELEIPGFLLIHFHSALLSLPPSSCSVFVPGNPRKFLFCIRSLDGRDVMGWDGIIPAPCSSPEILAVCWFAFARWMGWDRMR